MKLTNIISMVKDTTQNLQPSSNTIEVCPHFFSTSSPLKDSVFLDYLPDGQSSGLLMAMFDLYLCSYQYVQNLHILNFLQFIYSSS